MTTCVGGSVTINGVAVNAGGVTGTGTANTIPKFTAASTIGNSLLTDTGTLAYTGNGASGAAALLLSGTIFTGGGATNTKPQLLVEPNGATSTGWSNLGTVIGANAPSGFTGNLFDVQVNGVSKFKFDAAGTFTAMVGGQSFDQFGNVTASGEIRPGTTSSLSWLSRSRLQSPSDGVVELSNSAVTDFSRLQLGGTSSSFPALKRNNAVMVFRLADDSADGWFTYAGGNCFLQADQTNATTTFANINNCTINVTSGRRYSFRAVFYLSDSTAADGAKLDSNGGAATVTNFRMQCTAFDTALNFSTQQTTLTGVFAATTFTGAGMFECYGTFEPSSSSTFIPRFAQNAHTTGTLTLARGSHMQWLDNGP